MARYINIQFQKAKVFLETMDLAQENKTDIARLGETIFNLNIESHEISPLMQNKAISAYITHIVENQDRLSKIRNPS